MEWEPRCSGPTANYIPLAGITVKSGVLVGRSMKKLDAIRKLAAAMIVSDTATRHLQHTWSLLLAPHPDHVDCPHPSTHVFPSLPLLTEGVLLCNFPTCEMCVVCGVPQAAYPGIPHTYADVGYPPIKK
jgi:hypothetical protein